MCVPLAGRSGCLGAGRGRSWTYSSARRPAPRHDAPGRSCSSPRVAPRRKVLSAPYIRHHFHSTHSKCYILTFLSGDNPYERSRVQMLMKCWSCQRTGQVVPDHPAEEQADFQDMEMVKQVTTGWSNNSFRRFVTDDGCTLVTGTRH